MSDERESARRPMRERPRVAEVALAAATVLLWTTFLLMHERLSVTTSRLIGLGAVLFLVATFVVSDRSHDALRPAASLARIVSLIVLTAVLLYVGYLAALKWGMRDLTF